MDIETIQQLNRLNKDFYQKVSSDFDQSRQKPWEGWPLLLEESVVKKCQSVIDIGCGNGRFAAFLSQYQVPNYLGLDSNRALLKQAQQYAENFDLFSLKTIDIVSTLIDKSITNEVVQKTAGLNFQHPFLFCAFGVMHHIPSLELRQSFLNQFSAIMDTNDVLAISCWQFNRIPNLMDRRLSPETAELDSQTLEDNDFILDWQRGEQAYRYCHLVTKQEMESLAENANLTIVKNWESDGKTHNLNTYYLLQKKGYNQKI